MLYLTDKISAYFKQIPAVWHDSVQRGTEFHQRFHNVLQMLNLFASKEEPRAKEYIQKICVCHAKHQPVKLEYQRQDVSHPVAGIVRVPRAQHQPWYLDERICLQLTF